MLTESLGLGFKLQVTIALRLNMCLFRFNKKKKIKSGL